MARVHGARLIGHRLYSVLLADGRVVVGGVGTQEEMLGWRFRMQSSAAAAAVEGKGEPRLSAFVYRFSCSAGLLLLLQNFYSS